VAEVDVRWWLRVFALGLDEPRLEMNDVLAQRIVLRLDRLVIVLQSVQFPHLLLELLDVSLLALSKGSLCSTILRGAFRLRQLALSALATIAQAVVAAGISASTHHSTWTADRRVDVVIVRTCAAGVWHVVVAMGSVMGRTDHGSQLGS